MLRTVRTGFLKFPGEKGMDEQEKHGGAQEGGEVCEPDPQFPVSTREKLCKIPLSGEETVDGDKQAEDTEIKGSPVPLSCIKQHKVIESHDEDAPGQEQVPGQASFPHFPDVLLRAEVDHFHGAAFSVMEVGDVEEDVHPIAGGSEACNVGQPLGRHGFPCRADDAGRAHLFPVHVQIEGSAHGEELEGHGCGGRLEQDLQAIGGVTGTRYFLSANFMAIPDPRYPDECRSRMLLPWRLLGRRDDLFPVELPLSRESHRAVGCEIPLCQIEPALDRGRHLPMASVRRTGEQNK